MYVALPEGRKGAGHVSQRVILPSSNCPPPLYIETSPGEPRKSTSAKKKNSNKTQLQQAI